MQQNRIPAHLIQHPPSGNLDTMTMRNERVDQVFFSQRARAEMIFERFGRNRALHGLVIDERGKRQHQVTRAIIRVTGRKRYLHGDDST
jgi:hypothetical protein